MTTPKMDFIDLLVTVLREHEKDLDQLIYRLKETTERLERTQRSQNISLNYDVFGSLSYIGLDAESCIHMIIKKESSLALSKVIKDIKANFEGSEVKVRFEHFKRTH